MRVAGPGYPMRSRRAHLALLGAMWSAACSDVLVVDDEGTSNAAAAGATGVTTSSVSSSAATTSSSGQGGGGAMGGGGEGGGGPPGQVPGIVAVGYGGLRIVSRDDGLTWGDRVTDGAIEDIGTNLWSVAWSAGRWVVAGGARLLVSTDGVVWTDETASMPYPSCAGAAAFQGELWLGCLVNEYGYVYRSRDGLLWDEAFAFEQPFFYRVHLLAGGGRLVAFDNGGTTFQTLDGESWTPLDLMVPAFCEGEWNETVACGPDVYGSSWYAGTWLAATWPGAIRRSTDGVTYDEVYLDPEGYTVFDGRVFARGYVAP